MGSFLKCIEVIGRTDEVSGKIFTKYRGSKKGWKKNLVLNINYRWETKL